MTNIELYINNRLCDIQSPDKLGVRLNRVLINPAELATKDAQYSYSISLPASAQNNDIFGYSNVEEIADKFNVNYDARLIIDEVTVFNGKFRMSEISPDAYKGNLIIPAKKTIKEIFGDKKMNEVDGEWEFSLKGDGGKIKSIPQVINETNTDKGIPDCIFPYVLYGLMPKVKNASGNYSAKNVFDETVRLGLEDFPPSVNCLRAIEEIFQNTSMKGYDGIERPLSIGGDAFNDERLKNLYMSYKNPVDYPQEWNWGNLGKMRLKGRWENMLIDKDDTGKETSEFEHNFYINETENLVDSNRNKRIAFVADMLQGKMCKLDYENSYDNGTNVTQVEHKDIKDNPYKKTYITVPFSGLYKIKLDVKLALNREYEKSRWNDKVHIKLLSGTYKNNRSNKFNKRAYEIKLLRDFGEGFDYENMGIDSFLYKGNMPQEYCKYDTDGGYEPLNSSGDTKYREGVYYMPIPGEESVQFIDPCVNQNLICGFRWGKGEWGGDAATETDPDNPVINLFDGKYQNLSDHMHILSIKNGWSWDVQFSQKEKIFSAIHNKGYAMWGKPQELKDDGELVSEEGDDEHVTTLAWYDNTNKFKVNLSGIPLANKIQKVKDNDVGEGFLYQVVWLNKGERLTLVSTSDKGTNKHGIHQGGWVAHSVDFDLEIEPFRKDWNWVKISNYGTNIGAMDWKSDSDFVKDKVNLFRFLPSDEKVDDWLENFCKAFNLQLTQKDEYDFELNVKQRSQEAYSVIDLSHKVSLLQRTNIPLGLPDAYELGFKIEKTEQGYEQSKDDGGGRFLTGTIDGKTLSQTSSFSYNWFLNIKNNLKGGSMDLPIISNKEVWTELMNETVLNYDEMQKKLYTHYNQRFWFRNTSEAPHNIGAIFSKTVSDLNKQKGMEVLLPVLTNSFEGINPLVLNYEDEPYSLMRNFFRLIATNNSNYTEIECYLTPEEYDGLNGSSFVKYNSDIYYVASIDGYDPTFRSRTRLRLIRKTL